MKKFIFGSLITLFLVFGIQYYLQHTGENRWLEGNEAIIAKEIKKVGKLIVTEGHFSDVYNYNDSKNIMGDFFVARKRALVIINSKVQIVYDLSKMTYEIDKKNKILQVIDIPPPETIIVPDIRYYDLKQDYFNQFEAEDYNLIRRRTETLLRKKIAESTLVENAHNRLLSELSKVFILTSNMGWSLEYNSKPIDNANFSELLPLPNS